MNPPEKKRRGGKGRKKIEMKPIVNAKSRLVCFSKRRQGLFTKANELCNLCGAEVAIVVFSPSGTPFSYGHPSINDVLNRFLNGGAAPSDTSPAADDRFDLIKRNLEAEKLMRGQLEAALMEPWSIPKPFWWDADIHSMGTAELRDYERVLQQNQLVVAQAKHRLCFLEPTAEIGKSVTVAGAPGTGTSDFNGSDGGL